MRAQIPGLPPERAGIKMFGGVGFMLNGNLLVAASSRGLPVRVGKEAESEALRRPGANPMMMRGRVMGGYLRIESNALDARTVASWIQLARHDVEALPTKPMKSISLCHTIRPKDQ